MPSGAKKRKTAKKKKETGPNNNTNSKIHSHGDDDLKVHEEKESDGEVSSPALRDDHNHQQPFAEGEAGEMEKREDTPTVRSIATEGEFLVGTNGNGESTQKVEMDENNATQIDSVLKSDDDLDSKNVSIDYVESLKESNGSWVPLDSGSSSSSGSDNESHVGEENGVVNQLRESEVDAPNFVDKAGLLDVTQVTDGVLIVEAYDLDVREPKEEACDPVAANAPPVNIVKPVDLPELTQVTDGAPIIKANSLGVGAVHVVDSENDVSEEVVPVNDKLRVENHMSCNGYESGLKENGKHEGSEVPPVVMDLEPQPNEGKVGPTAGENCADSFCVVGFAAQEEEDKLLPSSCVAAIDTSNGEEHIRDSVISECSDSQPLVASAPRPVQTTSWKSCCGLFEVFTGGSNR